MGDNTRESRIERLIAVHWSNEDENKDKYWEELNVAVYMARSSVYLVAEWVRRTICIDPVLENTEKIILVRDCWISV